METIEGTVLFMNISSSSGYSMRLKALITCKRLAHDKLVKVHLFLY